MTELATDELEALWYIWWVQEPIATLIDLSYGCCDLSQGSTQAWWDSISPIPFGGTMTYLELEKFSTEQLEHEIKRRGEPVAEKAPNALENPDYSELQDLCSKYMYDIQNAEYIDDDYPHYIYEEAMKCLYGKDIFKYINPRS